MSALAGRKVTFSKNSGDGPDSVAARTKTVTIAGEPINITDDEDDGYQRLLESAVAERSVNIALEGILKGAEILGVVGGQEGIEIGNYTLNIPGIGSIVGDFAWSGMEIGAPYNEASTFTATVMSTGPYSVAGGTT